MKKLFLILIGALMISSLVYALANVCDGTAKDNLGNYLGSGYTVTVGGHTNCTGQTDSTSYFMVAGSPVPDTGDHYLIFTKSGSRTYYSTWFYYSQNLVHLGTITLRITPPPYEDD